MIVVGWLVFFIGCGMNFMGFFRLGKAKKNSDLVLGTLLTVAGLTLAVVATLMTPLP